MTLNISLSSYLPGLSHCYLIELLLSSEVFCSREFIGLWASLKDWLSFIQMLWECSLRRSLAVLIPWRETETRRLWNSFVDRGQWLSNRVDFFLIYLCTETALLHSPDCHMCEPLATTSLVLGYRQKISKKRLWWLDPPRFVVFYSPVCTMLTFFWLLAVLKKRHHKLSGASVEFNSAIWSYMHLAEVYQTSEVLLEAAPKYVGSHWKEVLVSL